MSQTRLRITSDGTPSGTKVFTQDGTLVKGVQLVSWHLGIGELARVTIEVRAVAVDLVGEGSMPEDPTAVVTLTEPQDAPEGPGFPPMPDYHCPECGTEYADPDEICVGTVESGDHFPVKVVETDVKQGGRRRLNVTGCKHVYKGTNSKGAAFNIYEVEATTEAGQLIQDKLTAWVELPLGVREFDVTPYEKDGIFKSWTLSVPKEQGGNAAAAREALASRVEYLEGQVEWLVSKVNSLEGALQSVLRGGQQPQQVPTPVGGRQDDDDQIPF